MKTSTAPALEETTIEDGIRRFTELVRKGRARVGRDRAAYAFCVSETDEGENLWVRSGAWGLYTEAGALKGGWPLRSWGPSDLRDLWLACKEAVKEKEEQQRREHLDFLRHLS